MHVESVETFDGDFEKIMNSKSEVRLGRLHLIDLAGERLSSLRSEETSSPVETQYINLSILALGMQKSFTHLCTISNTTLLLLYFSLSRRSAAKIDNKCHEYK